LQATGYSGYSMGISKSSLLILLIFLSMTAAYGDVVRQDAAVLEGKTYPNVYKWTNISTKPIAVVIAVHGLTLHGLIFDALARHLAERNFVVFAPDLRGYGRWCKTKVAGKQQENSLPSISYDQSKADLLDLIKAAKSDYSDIPLYCLGESLGAGMVLYAASTEPSMVDGLILSSPAIKRRLNLGPRFLTDTAKLVTNPNRELDLIPYMKRFASEDPRIVTETINDPLVRKKFTFWDLLRTIQTIKPTLKYADKVSPDLPVLVIQSNNDKVLYSKAIVDLLAHLQSEDQTVKWFRNHGHLMLETAYLQSDTLQTVDRWLDEHIYTKTTNLRMSQSAAQLADFSQDSVNLKPLAQE